MSILKKIFTKDKEQSKQEDLAVRYYYKKPIIADGKMINSEGVLEHWLKSNEFDKTFEEILFDLEFIKDGVVGINKVEYCYDDSDDDELENEKGWKTVYSNNSKFFNRPRFGNIRVEITNEVQRTLGPARLEYDAARNIFHPTKYVLEMTVDGKIYLQGYNYDKLIELKVAQISGVGPNQHIVITSGSPVSEHYYFLARRAETCPQYANQYIIKVSKNNYTIAINVYSSTIIQVAKVRELRNYLANILFPASLDKIYNDVMAISFEDTNNYTSIEFYSYYDGKEKESRFWTSDKQVKSTNIHKLVKPDNK